MEVVLSILLIVFCLLLYKLKRDILFPACMFGLMWSVIVLFSSFSWFGIYKPSQEVYSISFIGIAAYLVGTLIPHCRYTFGKRLKPRSQVDCQIRSGKNVTVIVVIITILSVVDTLGALKMLFEGYDTLSVRAAYYTEVYTEYFILPFKLRFVMRNFICGSFRIAIVPLAVAMVLNKEKNILIYACAIINVICNVITSGGRWEMLNVIAYVLVSLYILKKKRGFTIRDRRKWKRNIILIVTACAAGIVVLYIDRGIENVGESLYTYFCGNMTQFSQRLKTLAEDTYTYGVFTLNGVVYSVLFILTNIGLMPGYPQWYADFLVDSETQVAVNISQTAEMNAFVTPYFQLYMDGRLFAVILGMFIYGLLSRRIYYNYKQHMDTRSIAILLILIKGIIYTINRIPFYEMDYTISFFVVLLLTKPVYREDASYEQ